MNSAFRNGPSCSWAERLRRLARSGLASLGVEVRRASRPPELQFERNPVRAYELANRKVPSRFLAPLSSCVSFAGFRYGAQGWHPFAEALREHLRADGSPDACRALLQRYYATWTPQSLAQALVCPELEKDGGLTATLPYAIALPWSRMAPDEAREAFERIGSYEHAAFGAPELSISGDGYGLQGPVSEKKLELEIRRLLDLLRSIRCFGFENDRESVTAEVIVRGDDYQCVVKHGYHRLAVMSALGYTHIPVTIDQLLDESELHHWPQVVRGHWSAAAAEAYCNHLFSFDSSAWAAERGLLARS